MKNGHSGGNHPVKDLQTGRTELQRKITAMRLTSTLEGTRPSM